MDSMQVQNLKKSYGMVDAVKGISFSVKEGSFFALLGENGAGKSTTINIIATLLAKTAGTVCVNNHMVDSEDTEIRKSIGIVFQQNMLDDFLTVKENLYVRGSLYGLHKKQLKIKINEIAENLDAADIVDRKYGKLSGGQRRKADIMRALINDPKILILDEPTTGLDPNTRKKVWKTIENIQRKRNVTVFLTTHYMEEAAKADKIVIMHSGQIMETGTPEELRMRHSLDRLILIPKEWNLVKHSLEERKLIYQCEVDRIIVPIECSLDALEILQSMKCMLKGFEVIRGNMDDVFINITNQEVKL